MHKYRYILFDLDGTLTDPGKGIINSLIYALEHFGIKGNPQLLRRFIGPPLIDSFMRYYDFSESRAKKAIDYYREYFRRRGIFENTVYPGIPGLLKSLKAQGRILAVATTKPTVFARQILEHFEISPYFNRELIVGSFLDGRRTEKAEIISAVLKRFEGDKSPKIMIGDRKYDILGAKANNIDTIGVTYGYGDKEEIELTKPTLIVDSVSELTCLFCLE